jgi:hypothetical protein
MKLKNDIKILGFGRSYNVISKIGGLLTSVNMDIKYSDEKISHFHNFFGNNEKEV